MKRLWVLFTVFCLLSVSAFADDRSAFDAAVSYLNEAGLDITVTETNGNVVHFTLPGGGTGTYYAYGNFSPYHMNYEFEGITEEEMALFLNRYLCGLAELEMGLSPLPHLQPDDGSGEGRRNIEITVSNALLYMENEGDAWLQVLMHQLSLHDGNDALNSMRARLASRMLGKRDITPVDPKEGCAWYDALTLSVQDALPPVDAATYIDDPLLAQLTQEMITYTDNRKAGWGGLADVETDKTRNLVYLSVHKMEETKDTLTLWAMVAESQYALYDGTRYQTVNGSLVPMRLEYTKDSSGQWKLANAIESSDGTDYYPSVLQFCDGDQTLAGSIIGDFSVDPDQYFFRYLAHHGYAVPEKIPY